MIEILNLIENVDPNDAAALNEIDARVWCWLNNKKFEKISCNHQVKIIHFDRVQCRLSKLGYFKTIYRHKHYTRSRDALKAIRPEGYVWYASSNQGMHSFVFHKNDTHEFLGEVYSTEELAELHAVIQAIASERN